MFKFGLSSCKKSSQQSRLIWMESLANHSIYTWIGMRLFEICELPRQISYQCRLTQLKFDLESYRCLKIRNLSKLNRRELLAYYQSFIDRRSVNHNNSWISRRRQGLKSWREFFKTNKFKAPSGVATAGRCMLINVEQFQSNYLCVFIVLFFYCILTSPLLLIALAACCGAIYFIKVKNTETNRVVIAGREISPAYQYAGVAVLSFPLFYVARAGATIWISSGEYLQMSGRAGRRGLDERGICILIVDQHMGADAAKQIIKGEPDPLNSQFRLTYNMVLNLMRVGGINPEYMLERSFYQFQNYAMLPGLYEKVKKLERQYQSFHIPNELETIGYYKIKQEIASLGIHLPIAIQMSVSFKK